VGQKLSIDKASNKFALETNKTAGQTYSIFLMKSGVTFITYLGPAAILYKLEIRKKSDRQGAVHTLRNSVRGGGVWWVCYGLLRGGRGSEPLLRNEKKCQRTKRHVRGKG